MNISKIQQYMGFIQRVWKYDKRWHDMLCLETFVVPTNLSIGLMCYKVHVQSYQKRRKMKPLACWFESSCRVKVDQGNTNWYLLSVGKYITLGKISVLFHMDVKCHNGTRLVNRVPPIFWRHSAPSPPQGKQLECRETIFIFAELDLLQSANSVHLWM